MQASRSGVYGEVLKYTEKGMKDLLEDPEVDHVEVFKPTKSELKRRMKLSGKKYGKVPRISKK